MNDLIEALQILAKYGNPVNPTNCSHDELFVNISPSLVTEQDKERLEELSFSPSDDDGFNSFRFGSC